MDMGIRVLVQLSIFQVGSARITGKKVRTENLQNCCYIMSQQLIFFNRFKKCFNKCQQIFIIQETLSLAYFGILGTAQSVGRQPVV